MIVKTALLKDIVDKPDYRKLQKPPEHVLGGGDVYWVIVIAAVKLVWFSIAMRCSLQSLR